MDRKIWLLILFIISFNSCKTIAYRKYIRVFTLSFGQSGGFTGATSEYILKGKDGSFNHIKEFTSDTNFIKTIPDQHLKRIFRLADSRKVKNINMDVPGNMTNFIRLYANHVLVKDWQWAEGAPIPETLQELYTELHKLK